MRSKSTGGSPDTSAATVTAALALWDQVQRRGAEPHADNTTLATASPPAPVNMMAAWPMAGAGKQRAGPGPAAPLGPSPVDMGPLGDSSFDNAQFQAQLKASRPISDDIEMDELDRQYFVQR